MAMVTIQEAQAKLPDLIHKLVPGEEVVITENNLPVAKLVSELPKSKPGLRPPPGLGKGCTIVSDDEAGRTGLCDGTASRSPWKSPARPSHATTATELANIRKVMEALVERSWNCSQRTRGKSSAPES